MSDSVGYGRPPAHTRFQQGRSGNPKGRPKGKKNATTIFQQVAGEKIRVSEGGRARTITKLEAMMRQLIAKALTGDLRAIREVMSMNQLLDLVADQGVPDLPDKEKSDELMRHFVERLAKMKSDAASLSPSVGPDSQNGADAN